MKLSIRDRVGIAAAGLSVPPDATTEEAETRRGKWVFIYRKHWDSSESGRALTKTGNYLLIVRRNGPGRYTTVLGLLIVLNTVKDSLDEGAVLLCCLLSWNINVRRTKLFENTGHFTIANINSEKDFKRDISRDSSCHVKFCWSLL